MATLEETNPQPGDFIRLKYLYDGTGPEESTMYRGKVVECITGNSVKISYGGNSVVFYSETEYGSLDVVDYVPASEGQWVEIVTADFIGVVWRDSAGRYMAYPDSNFKTHHIEGAIHITPLVAQRD